MILVSSIQAAVAREHGIPVEVMRESDGFSGSRKPERAWPRQEAMRLAFLLTDHGKVRIGQFFGGRHYTTVLSACRRVEQRTDAAMRARMRRVTLELIRG